MTHAVEAALRATARPRAAGAGFRASIAALIAAILLGLVAGAGAAHGDEPIPVTASILPLGDFVEQVGGARVKVTLLVPPGQNPHVFSLKPSQVTALQRARLVVLNGLGLEFWADQVVASLDNRRVPVLRLGENLGLKPDSGVHREDEEADKGEHGEPHDHGPINPHVWLDPVLAMGMVRQIRDALAGIDPAHGAEYGARTEHYLAELQSLDEAYRTALGGVSQHTFIAFHSAFDHLAARYGLIQLTVLKGSGQSEPSPARVAEIIRTARRLRVKAIFAEPQLPDRAARLIAEEAGIGVARLVSEGAQPGDTYLGFMRENLRQLVSALR
jgi:zinc transport system substrate-binding protein